MSTDLENPPGQTAASLVSGILGDLQQLVEQQFQLTRREIEDELRQRATAGGIFFLGLGVSFLSMILLCLTLVHLLHWLTSPPGTDVAWLPLWGCHAVLAAVFAIIGGILTLVGRARFQSVTPFLNPVTEILQEPDQWTTPQK